jgi:hypothetical protein
LGSCNTTEKPKDLKSEIVKFDSTNGKTLQQLCDTLIKIIGRNRNYIMKLNPATSVPRFIEVNDSGQMTEHFSPLFTPMPNQIDFLEKAGAISINYKRKTGFFYTQLKSYWINNQNIWLHINYDNRKVDFYVDSILYSIGNRYYTLSKD